MTMNGKPSGFSLEDFKAYAKSASMKRGRAETIIDEVRNVVAQWQYYASESRVNPEQRDKIESALRLEHLRHPAGARLPEGVHPLCREGRGAEQIYPASAPDRRAGAGGQACPRS